MAVFDNINLSTDAGIITSATEYHERALLRNVMPKLIYARDMQMRNLPAHNGRRVQFRKMVPFGALMTPLAEGVTPEGQKIAQTDLWATIKPYGGFVALTDEINWAMMDDMQRETNTLLSNQARLTIDGLAREARCSGMNVQYAGGRASRAAVTANDKLTYAEIKKAVRTLKKANAPTFSDGCYHAIVGPDTVFDLTADAMWIDVAKYQDKSKVETGELGKMAGVKFFETTEAKVYTAETALYDSVASITVTATSADKKQLTIGAISDFAARQLVGKMVQLTISSAKEPAYIERVDATGTVYLRWPASGTVSAITPAGAGASGVEVHATVVYGADHAGGVSLNGNGHNIQVIIKPAGSSGAEDPLNQRGTIAWKAKGLCYTILQDAFGVRIEHAVSA